MTHPTKAQRRVLDWYVDHWSNGPPTLRDAAESLGYASPSSIHKHIRALVRKGFMRGSGRYLMLVPDAISRVHDGNYRRTCWWCRREF